MLIGGKKIMHIGAKKDRQILIMQTIRLNKGVLLKIAKTGIEGSVLLRSLGRIVLFVDFLIIERYILTISMAEGAGTEKN